MSTAYLIAKAEQRRRAERSAEAARSLPLYAAEIAEPPEWYREQALRSGDEETARTFRAPDWTIDY